MQRGRLGDVRRNFTDGFAAVSLRFERIGNVAFDVDDDQLGRSHRRYYCLIGKIRRGTNRRRVRVLIAVIVLIQRQTIEDRRRRLDHRRNETSASTRFAARFGDRRAVRLRNVTGGEERRRVATFLLRRRRAAGENGRIAFAFDNRLARFT